MTQLSQAVCCPAEYNRGSKSTISTEFFVICSQNTYEVAEVSVARYVIVPDDFLPEFTSCLHHSSLYRSAGFSV